METNVPFMKANIDKGIAKQVHKIDVLQHIFFSIQQLKQPKREE
ncbi:hypothetical protein THF5H11_10647 [Vibrio jasicida]|nr:hypothetical protein THF5H11_10647 [Vibrio jasicida]